MRTKNVNLALIVTFAMFVIGTSSEATAKMLRQQSSPESEVSDAKRETSASVSKEQGDATTDREPDRDRAAQRNRLHNVAPLKHGHPVTGLTQASRAEGGAVHETGARQFHAAELMSPNEALNNSALPTRPVSIARRGASVSDLRHRGPNPAVIDGLAGPKNENAAGLSGTRIHRNP